MPQETGPEARKPKTSAMKYLACLLIAASMNSLPAAEDEPKPFVFPRSAPEEQGVSSAAILDFVKAADEKIDSVHSFMLVRHGKVVAEGWWSPYGADLPHSMYSLSKSFTSTAVGMAIAEGKLSLDDPVLKFFPEDAPSKPSDFLKAMRVRDLLIMSTGQLSNDVYSVQVDGHPGRITQEFLELPVTHKPGTFFWYNTPATYMLSAIVQKVTGVTVRDYLTPRLFEPLGIGQPEWESSAQGMSLGGTGLHLRTEDIARFGQFYLKKGNWQGQQLVPGAWVETATSRQTSNGSDPGSDWEQGYGYQFWRCRHGFYRGDGAFGQFCIVMQDRDAVVAMTSGTKDMGGVMNLVWDKLLPGMHEKRLKANPEGVRKLKETLGGLTLHTQKGGGTPGGAARFLGRHFTFATNSLSMESAALENGGGDGAAVLVLRRDGVDYRVPCGAGTWAKSRLAYATMAEQPVAASGGWTAEGVYAAKIWFYETPYCLTVKVSFPEGTMKWESEFNVATRGPTQQPELTGHVE
jgi:CubicO group peptidase (beta-lactamase class C family)